MSNTYIQIPIPAGSGGNSTGELRNSVSSYRMFTDFLNIGSGTGLVTSDMMTFASVSAGSGSGIQSYSTGVDSSLKCVGVGGQYSGTTTSSAHTMTSSILSILPGNSIIDIQVRAFTDFIGTISDGYEWTFGLIDNNAASLNHVDGIYFRFLANGVNTNFECVTSSNSVRTTTTTAVPIVANTAHVFKVSLNESATEAKFYIDTTLVATHTTNIPTGVGRWVGAGMKMYKSLGTTSRFMYYDWYQFDFSQTITR